MSGFSVGADPLDGATIATLIEALELGPFTMVTTVAQTLDSLLVDNYGMAEWKVRAVKSDGTTFDRTVRGEHNGLASADATLTQSSAIGTGISSELTDITVDLNGVGVAQVMRLRMTFTYGAGTWKVSTWRLPQKPPQYA